MQSSSCACFVLDKNACCIEINVYNFFKSQILSCVYDVYFSRVKIILDQYDVNYCALGVFLLFQIYYYHNVKCRREMFDKDIVMLQVTTCSCFHFY